MKVRRNEIEMFIVRDEFARILSIAQKRRIKLREFLDLKEKY